MQVRELMTPNVSHVVPTDTIQRAAQVMESADCGSVPVCDANLKVTGMITDRDIVIRAVAQSKAPTAQVSEVLSKKVIACRPETDAHEAADLMAQNQIRRLPVTDASGKLVGIVAIADLATVNIHINEAGDALSKISQPTAASNAIQ